MISEPRQPYISAPAALDYLLRLQSANTGLLAMMARLFPGAIGHGWRKVEINVFAYSAALELEPFYGEPFVYSLTAWNANAMSSKYVD